MFRTRGIPMRNWLRVGNAPGVGGTEHFFRSDIDKVRMPIPNMVQSGLDILHIVKVFHGAFFAGSNNQALLALHERNLGDPLHGNKALYRLGPDVDEGAQAVVLAEIAARGFVAGGAVL